MIFFWLAFIGSFVGIIYLLNKLKSNTKLQDYILTKVLESKPLTKFYINYIIRDPYWKNEIRLRNHLNKKVHSSIVGYETQVMFRACWKYLQTIPFDSQEADIVIAGLSVWSRTLEDSRYYPDPLYYYPQKSCSEIFKICYGDNAPDDFRGNDMILEIIKKIGHHALIEKDLEFDGMISRFMDNDFDSRDWRDFTDRFIKYNLLSKTDFD